MNLSANPAKAASLRLRTDRLLGFHDTPADHRQYERALEGTRRAEQAKIYKPIRRGWCLGTDEYREKLLDRIRGKPTSSHLAWSAR